MIPREQFYSLMKFLEAAFPRWQPGPETNEAYYVILSDLPFELVKAAIQDYASDDTPWPPSSGQIRGRAISLVERSEDRPSVSEAWGRVVKAIGVYGYMREPQFEDSRTTRAVEAIGGWRFICTCPEDMQVSNRARFIAAYETIGKRDQDGIRLLPQVQEVISTLKVGGGLSALSDSRKFPEIAS